MKVLNFHSFYKYSVVCNFPIKDASLNKISDNIIVQYPNSKHFDFVVTIVNYRNYFEDI